MYADDLALVATSPEELQALLNETQKWAEDNFATINTEKTHAMAFMETNITQANRKTNMPPFTLHYNSCTGVNIQTIKEVKTFKYLGLLLDQWLDLTEAMKATKRNFWHAHSKARQLDLHVYGLHAKDQLMLWKQLVLSTTDIILPFIHLDTQATQIDTMLDTSLSSIFAPKSWRADCLNRALRSELGIPQAQTYIKLAALRLHARINMQAPGMPANTLYSIVKSTLRLKKGDANNKPLPNRVRTALHELHMYQAWISLQITHPNPPKNNIPIKPQTTYHSWIHNLACKLAQQEYAALCEWANILQPDEENIQPNQGRAAQYFKITKPDQLARAATLSLSKSPFQPFPYIQYFTDPQFTALLLRIRSQNSIFPTHMTLIRHSKKAHSSQFTRRPYNERVCCYCITPRSTWGLTAPPTDSPLGSEEHIILHCPHSTLTNMRTKLQAKLNMDLRDIIISDAEPHNPWYDLEAELRLPTLLACTPPNTWHLSKYRTAAWYRSLEKRLKKQLTRIITHCHAYNKDLRTSYQ